MSGAAETELIITGALPGQETENPALIRSLNLGVVCTDPASIPFTIEQLTRDHGRVMEEIRKSQRAWRDPDAAGKIVSLILDCCESFTGSFQKQYAVQGSPSGGTNM